MFYVDKMYYDFWHLLGVIEIILDLYLPLFLSWHVFEAKYIYAHIYV